MTLTPIVTMVMPIVMATTMVVANTGWLESLSTRLRIHADDYHELTSNVPAMAGVEASLRKSSLHKFVMSKLVGGPNVPAHIRDGRCVCIEGTGKPVKSHRINILNYGRSGISSDEIACVYKTAESKDPSSSFVRKRRLCTFVHCETDKSITVLAPF